MSHEHASAASAARHTPSLAIALALTAGYVVEVVVGTIAGASLLHRLLAACPLAA